MKEAANLIDPSRFSIAAVEKTWTLKIHVQLSLHRLHAVQQLFISWQDYTNSCFSGREQVLVDEGH